MSKFQFGDFVKAVYEDGHESNGFGLVTRRGAAEQHSRKAWEEYYGNSEDFSDVYWLNWNCTYRENNKILRLVSKARR